MRKDVKILVVDDDEAMREVLQMRLQEWGFDVMLARDGMEAQQTVERHDPDLVISDVVMPEVSGIELLRKLKGQRFERPVIMLTAHGTVEIAVDAMKQGALDFLTKPIDYSKLKAVVKAACRDTQRLQESRRIEAQLERESEKGFGPFIGVSPNMKEVYELIRSVASSDASVVITGESGTGKELVARTIHQMSPRGSNPFIAVNAAAIPSELMESEIFGHEKGAFTGAAAMRPGCFELANGGTLFLDEIAEMPGALQPKLLRVLDNGRVRRLGGKEELAFDVRVLAATNRDPRAATREGRLRDDLYYRLNVFTILLPALRDRRCDIPLLVQHLIREFNRKHGAAVSSVRDDALEILKSYSWPGNVRELRNTMERAVILARGKWIEITHLPPYLREPEVRSGDSIVLPLGVTAADAERELILKTLELTSNNKAEAARRLGLDVKTIRNKLKSYGRDE